MPKGSLELVKAALKGILALPRVLSGNGVVSAKTVLERGGFRKNRVGKRGFRKNRVGKRGFRKNQEKS